MSERSMLDHALELAEAGWLIFPLSGKLPIIPKAEGGAGFRDGTTDVERIRTWWSRWPRANIGIAVPVGLVVLDIDPRHSGSETLDALEARYGALPRTLAVTTGSGGTHLYLSTDRRDLEQKPLGDGLDSRVGGRGYVLSPPSVHPQTRKPYTWVQPLAPVARAPYWVLQRLQRPVRVHDADRPALRIIDGGAGLLTWAADRVARAPEGQRHLVLRNTAILLGGFVAGGAIREADAREALRAVAASWPNRRKSEGTIDDGLRYGRGRPLEAS